MITIENDTIPDASNTEEAAISEDLLMDRCILFTAKDDCIYFEFILLGIITNVVGIIGLIGNLMCIAVLRRPQMKRNSTNVILVALSTFDAVVIVTREISKKQTKSNIGNKLGNPLRITEIGKK